MFWRSIENFIKGSLSDRIFFIRASDNIFKEIEEDKQARKNQLAFLQIIVLVSGLCYFRHIAHFLDLCCPLYTKAKYDLVDWPDHIFKSPFLNEFRGIG